MSDNRFEFTRDNIDFYLNEVAKEYSKRCKKEVPAEFILIGGASVLINYGILDVRTVAGEYLIAMKLRSGRQYKSDLSDVLGILSEHEKRGVPIGFEQVKKAVADLYGDWKLLPETSLEYIDNVMRDG